MSPGPRRRRFRYGCLLSALLVPASPGAADAYDRPASLERVSLTSSGAEAEDASYGPAITPDGRYVAFVSAAANLVPGDTNGAPDVFVHDRELGTTERVSVASDGGQGFGGSALPSISEDGRLVSFLSTAAELVPGDTNGFTDVFVQDRLAGTTRIVSAAPDAAPANGRSSSHTISADGRYVAFGSQASNLVPGDSGISPNIFVHDLFTGTTEQVDVSPAGAPANLGSTGTSISADGRFVAFQSAGSNLVPGDTNGTADIFVRDRNLGTTSRVSVDSNGNEAEGPSEYDLRISADGSRVVFRSSSNNLVPGDAGGMDVFVHDLSDGMTVKVSDPVGGPEKVAFPRPALSISSTGRWVAFATADPSVVPGDPNEADDVFLVDVDTGAVEAISLSSGVTRGAAPAGNPAIASEGRFVAFDSPGPEFVGGDGNGASDIFVLDRGPEAGVGAVQASIAGDSLAVSGLATFSTVPLASVTDANADGAAAVGAELTGARVSYMPERDQLHVRWDLQAVPGSPPAGVAIIYVPAIPGIPGVVYGMEISVAGACYEVRAARVGASAPTPGSHVFALYRCGSPPTEVGTLAGSFATLGRDIRVVVPLSALGAEAGETLTGIRAFTGIGDLTAGTIRVIDEAALGDVVVPEPLVDIGIAPEGTPASEVAYETAVPLAEGRFATTIDISSLPPGRYDLWAKGCLDTACHAEVAHVERS